MDKELFKYRENDLRAAEFRAWVSIALVVVLTSGICAGFSIFEHWQYTECLNSGHSSSWCMANRAGCVG